MPPLSIHPYQAAASLSKATLRKLSPQALLLTVGCWFSEASHVSGKALAVPLACVWLLPRIQAGDGEGARESACKALRAGLHLVHQLLQHLQPATHTH